MPDFHILIPEATRNLITNPSFENNTNGWVPEWDQEATFEDQELTPNPTGFDSTAGVGANLDVNNAAAIRGNFGLEVTLAGVGSESYGILSDPNNETLFTVEFFLDLNSLVMANTDVFAIMQPFTVAPAQFGSITLLYTLAAGYQLQNIINLDVGNDFGPLVPITDEPHLIRWEFRASSAPLANDGFSRMYVDGILVSNLTGEDTDTRSLDSLRIGAPGGIDAGTAGTIYFDNIRWLSGLQPLLGSSIERTLERARFGRYSTRVYTDGHTLNEGVYSRVDTTNINELVTASAYVRGEGKLRIRIFDGLTGAESISKPLTINDNRWHRLEIRGRAVGGDDLRVYIETAETAQELIFYVDGVQLEEQEEATTYCDGEQQGCRWNGIFHASISERNAEEMSGGIWFPIREEGCTPDIYVTVISGFGVPPITLNRQRTASTPGSVFDSLKVEERTMQLIIWVKDEDVKKTRGLVLERLHELRQNLIDLVKPDISPDTEPFMLRYTDNGKSLTIRCRYNAGLEFDGDIRNKFTNTIPLRLLALDPYWEEDNQEVAVLDSENPLTDVYVLTGRINGAWQSIAQGFGDAGGQAEIVEVISEDANGRIYIGGLLGLDGDGNLLRNIVYLNDDYSQMIEPANGLNDRVLDIKAHPNGLVYICGRFTADGVGAPFNYIVEYDPATDAFAALGAGLNTWGEEIAISPNGDVIVAGRFTTAGGVAADYVAKWDGLAWSPVGDPVGDLALIAGSRGASIIIRDNDEIYVGGRFVTATDQLFNLLFDGTTWTELGDSGAAQNLQPTIKMIFDSDGTILMTFSDPIAVHRWNGSSYSALGAGLARTGGVTPIMASIGVDPDGLVYAAGVFSESGDVELNRSIAIFNSSIWSNFDFDFTAANLFAGQSVLARSNGDIWLGMSTELGGAPPINAVGSGFTDVKNISTADVFPIITIIGSGRMLWIENQTTGQRIYMDFQVFDDEIIELDFRNNTLVVTSNYRGSVPDAVLPNSDNLFLSAGKLNAPRENKIAVLMVDEVDPTFQIRYVPVHWSIDATAS